MRAAATYRLLKVNDERCVIRRGARNVGTISRLNGAWHGRLRIENADAITAHGDDPVVVFDRIIDERLRRATA